MTEIMAYSPDSNTHYRNWDELLKAESNGYVVIGVSSRANTVPIVIGPFVNQEAAQRARPRLRKKWAEDEAPHTIKAYVRPCWKDLKRSKGPTRISCLLCLQHDCRGGCL